MSGVISPFSTASDNDRGSIVEVFVVISICLSVLFTTVRLVVASYRKVQVVADDWLIVISLCFGIAHSVLLGKSSGAGLGRHEATLSPDDVEKYFKLSYASQLLAIVSLSFSKFSSATLIQRIGVNGTDKRPYTAFLLMISIWTILCLFIIAFQCRVPHPWQYTSSHCPSNGKLYFLIGATNILTDAILALYMVPKMMGIAVPNSKRITVIVVFGARLLVCVISILQLAWWPKKIPSDVTWDLVKVSVLGTIIVHLSIITANIPRINPVLAKLQSGALDVLPPSMERASQNPTSTLRNFFRSKRTVTVSSSEGRAKSSSFSSQQSRQAGSV